MEEYEQKFRLRRCLICDKVMEVKRSTAKYCSSACRSKAWKLKNEIPQGEPELREEIEQHELCRLASLILEFHNPNFTDFEDELEGKIFQIHGELIAYEWVEYELKFRIRHRIGEDEYRSVLDMVRETEDRMYVTEHDLNKFKKLIKKKIYERY